MSAQVATPLTVAAYLTAVQTAIAAGNFLVARTQLFMAEAELAKLPVTDTGENNSSTTFRQTLSTLRASIDALEEATARASGSRIAPVRFV